MTKNEDKIDRNSRLAPVEREVRRGRMMRSGYEMENH